MATMTLSARPSMEAIEETEILRIGELASVIQDGDLFGKFVADEGCGSTLAMQTLKQAAVAFQGMSLLVHRFEVAGMKKPDTSTLKMAAQVVKDSYAKALD
ncbi:unnamed protein product, partial [Cladocopium goreaui]